MANYTPGPWEAGVHAVHATDGRWVATVQFPEDARLIAAAPDLLAACEAAWEWLAAGLKNGGRVPDGPIDWAQLAAEASRKARGEAVPS